MDGPVPWFTLVLYCIRIKAQGLHSDHSKDGHIQILRRDKTLSKAKKPAKICFIDVSLFTVVYELGKFY